MDPRRPTEIRSFDDGVDRWRLVDVAPTAALRGPVDRYCLYDERTTSFSARREPASTSVVLLFNLGPPIRLTGADGAEVALDTGQAFVAGFADGTSISCSSGVQSGVQVYLSWEALTALCRRPLAELLNRVLPLHELLGSPARELGGRLVEARNLGRRVELLDAFLGRRLAQGPPPDPRLARAVGGLRRDPATPVAALARGAGWSHRHFLQRFRAATGLRPGRFARLVRFERFTRALQAQPQARIADLAQDAGFYDQPHLVREVRSFAAMTPSEMRRRLQPGGGFKDS